MSTEFLNSLFQWVSICALGMALVGGLGLFFTDREIKRRQAEQIETLKREAEADRLARVRIEERLADRVIGEAKAKRIAEALKPFSGIRAVVKLNALKAEAVDFAVELMNVLSQRCGFTLSQAPPPITTIEQVISGLRITVAADADDNHRGAALALANVLADLGFNVRGPISASGPVAKPKTDLDRPPIGITVGEK